MAAPVIYAGYLVRCALGGYAWQVLHYLIGLRRLGHDAYFYEDTRHVEHAYDPETGDTGTDYRYGVRFAADLFARHGLADRWVFCDARRDAYSGLGREETRALFSDARLLINGGGVHRFTEEERRGKTTVYIDMDPAYTQLRLASDDRVLEELLGEHDRHFTFGENIGTPRCAIPAGKLEWRPTRQPVVVDLWPHTALPEGAPFTTVGKWDTADRDVTLAGERYTWRKRVEWAKIMSLPQLTGAPFRIAMDVKNAGDLAALQRAGWNVFDPLVISRDPEEYRRFISASRGEFTTAKDVNVRLRSGWFSDRSACYLAAGRPVVTQDTGFGDVLPSGEGLLAYRTLDDAVRAIEDILADPARHGAAARRTARQHFAAEEVLGALLGAL